MKNKKVRALLNKITTEAIDAVNQCTNKSRVDVEIQATRRRWKAAARLPRVKEMLQADADILYAVNLPHDLFEIYIQGLRPQRKQALREAVAALHRYRRATTDEAVAIAKGDINQ